MITLLSAWRKDLWPCVPFILLLVTSLFLETAAWRMVFYLLVPFFIWLLYQHRASLSALVKTYSFGLLCAYLGWALLTLLWSELMDAEIFFDSLRDIIGLAIFLPALTLFILKQPPLPLHRVGYIFSGVVITYAFLATGAFLSEQGFSFDEQRLEAWGRYVNPIHFAYILGIACLYLLALPTAKVKREDIFRYALISLCLVFVFLSGTRSVFLGVVGCGFLLAFVGKPRAAMVLGAAVALSLIGAIILFEGTLGGFIARGDNARLGLWADALLRIKENWLLGYGITAEPKFCAGHYLVNGWRSAHNAFIGHVFTGGVIFLGIYLAVICNMSWQSLRGFYIARKQALSVSTVFFCLFSGLLVGFFLIISQFNFNIFTYFLHIHWLVFWVPFCMCWALEVRFKNYSLKAKTASV